MKLAFFRMSGTYQALVAATLLAAGCSTTGPRDPDYARVLRSVHRAAYDPDPATSAVPPVAADLAGAQPVERYVAVALAQNPEIQAARKRVEAMAYRVPQAASLEDPTLTVTAFPEQVQTAAGEQELLMTASQRFPWRGKLRLRAEVAEAEVDVARAELAAAELGVIEQVKRGYYELYFLQQAIRISEEDRRLLLRLIQVVEREYRVGRVPQQDVLRAQVELLDLENQLIALRQQLESARAKLARVLHVSPDTELVAVERLAQDQLPGNVDRLYQLAVAARPELHAQVSSVLRDRRRVELAQLQYYPDVTAGLTWIDVASSGLSAAANGRDAFLLSLGVNLPIYQKRLDAGVREAQANVVSSARQYDSLRDQTLAEVKDLFVQVQTQRELLDLFRDEIIPKADQTLRVSEADYEGGQMDILQLIENWQQLLRFQITAFRLEAQLWQSLASLERAVGGQLQIEEEEEEEEEEESLPAATPMPEPGETPESLGPARL